MPSPYLTATAKLFAPLLAPPTSLEPPPPPHGSDDPADLIATQPSSRPWELRKDIPGQSTPEAYTLTTLTCLLFFLALLDSLLRIIPLREFHLLWIVLICIALTPLAIAEVTLLSALAGDACSKFGFLQKWIPRRRTGLFFQAACITYAAWATGEPTFAHLVGYCWLSLVAFNTVSAIILSAKDASSPSH